MSITTINRFKLKPGSESACIALFKELIEKARVNEPGMLSYVMYQALNDPQTFVAREEYADMDARIFHSSRDYIKDGLGRLMPLLDGLPESVTLQEIASK